MRRLNTPRALLHTLAQKIGLRSRSTPKARVVREPGDFERLGLKPGSVPELWEDGLRTGGARGTYEWWYFDAHLEDGTIIVVVFFTKPFTETFRGLHPLVTVDIDFPDGRKVVREFRGDANDFHASTATCDVQIGKNYFRGDLKNYQIHFEDEALILDIDLERTTQSWRPQTGHFMFGEKNHFAWVVPVPKGNAQVRLQHGGQSRTLQGSAYHDHNFGNKPMNTMIDHWYWSRSEIGPYTVIAADIVAGEAYGWQSTRVINLSRDGQTEFDDGRALTLYRTHAVRRDVGGKPLSPELMFVFEEGNTRYEYILKQDKVILETLLLDKLVADRAQRMLAKALTGFDGAYYRMAGSATLNVYCDGRLEESFVSKTAVWELMYFGKT